MAVTAASATSVAAATSGVTNSASIAQNFSSFLQLLTTQLRNQNPLDPLDTNQFTQQLVQFAQVEQQINTNSSLSTLVSLQQATQTASAMSFLGATVRIDGASTALTNGKAAWSFSVEKPASAVINVLSVSGELVYSETRSLSAGQQSFSWNGRDSFGNKLADGNYTISVLAKDAAGQSVAVSTEVEGVVDGVDLSKTPPVLSMGGQTFSIDKIKQVRRPSTS